MTASEWAAELGITRESLYKKARRLGSYEAAIAAGRTAIRRLHGARPGWLRPGAKPYRITHDGRTMSAGEWAAELGITIMSLYKRASRLGSYEAAIAAAHVAHSKRVTP